MYRAAVIALFSSFLPAIGLFAYIFLFLHIIIQLFQLLFYSRRPKTIVHHYHSLLSWGMSTINDIAVPFVVFYWVSVSWSMLACEDPIIQQPDVLGAFSLGVFYCSTFEKESIEDPRVLRYIVGIAVIPAIIFVNRMTKHCIKKTPELVSNYEDYRAACRFAQLEASYLNASLNKQEQANLTTIYKHRQSIENQLFDSIQKYHASSKLNKNFNEMVKLAVLEGINSDSRLIQTATFVLNASASVDDMSYILELQTISVHDESKALSTSNTEKLILAILEATECQHRSQPARAIHDIANVLETSKNNHFEDLLAEFSNMAKYVRAKLHTGHLTQDTADGLLQFLYFLKRCVNTKDQPTESYVESDNAITTQAQEVEGASRLWVLRQKSLQPISEQKVSEDGPAEMLTARHGDWEQMSAQEHHLFLQENHIKPVSKCENKEQQDDVLVICATHGLNPFAYNLLVPGKPIERVGTEMADTDKNVVPKSCEARMLLIETDGSGVEKINTTVLPILWSGLQCVMKIISRTNNSRVVREKLQLEDSNQDSVDEDNFVKVMHSLMNNETLLKRRFGTTKAKVKASVNMICERIQGMLET